MNREQRRRRIVLKRRITLRGTPCKNSVYSVVKNILLFLREELQAIVKDKFFWRIV